jgi:hypothetical protein
MDTALSVRDVIKNSLLDSGLFESSLTAATLVGMVVSLAAAMAMGFLIFAVYHATYRGVAYARPFAAALVGMTVLTCMVTLAISTNIVLSLGMVGALSIVRYRTAVKEPYDLMFLFWAISTGITVGARMYVLSCLGAAFVMLYLFLLNARPAGGKAYILVVRCEGGDVEPELARALKGLRYDIKSKTARGGAVELAIEVNARRGNLSFAERVGALEGVTEWTLVQYNGEYRG